MVQLPLDWIGVKLRSLPSDVREGISPRGEPKVEIVNRTKLS
jgi:hypothetical protein